MSEQNQNPVDPSEAKTVLGPPPGTQSRGPEFAAPQQQTYVPQGGSAPQQQPSYGQPYQQPQFQQPQQPAYAQPQYQQPSYAPQQHFQQPPATQAPGQYPAGQPAAGSTMNAPALVSFIVGLVGLVFSVLLGSIGSSGVLAIVLGLVALPQFKHNPRQTNKWMAIAGIAMGAVALVLVIVRIVLAIVND